MCACVHGGCRQEGGACARQRVGAVNWRRATNEWIGRYHGNRHPANANRLLVRRGAHHRGRRANDGTTRADAAHAARHDHAAASADNYREHAAAAAAAADRAGATAAGGERIDCRGRAAAGASSLVAARRGAATRCAASAAGIVPRLAADRRGRRRRARRAARGRGAADCGAAGVCYTIIS